MGIELVTLEGEHVRLEPLERRHAAALVEASAPDTSPYTWSLVPVGREAIDKYIESALALRDAGTALPFVTVRKADNKVIGSTRFFELERWPWPEGSDHKGKHVFDTGEIGYTWLTRFGNSHGGEHRGEAADADARVRNVEDVQRAPVHG